MEMLLQALCILPSVITVSWRFWNSNLKMRRADTVLMNEAIQMNCDLSCFSKICTPIGNLNYNATSPLEYFRKWIQKEEKENWIFWLEDFMVHEKTKCVGKHWGAHCGRSFFSQGDSLVPLGILGRWHSLCKVYLQWRKRFRKDAPVSLWSTESLFLKN